MRIMSPGRLTLAAFKAEEAARLSKGEIVSGSLTQVIATFDCGGCGLPFKQEVSTSGNLPKGWDMFDWFVDAARADMCSVQHGYILCQKCTREADALVPEGIDRNATREEVHRHFQNKSD